MKANITQLGFGQVLEVELKEGESMFAEPGAFLAGQGEFTVESKMLGGIVSGALRSLAGGESPFLNEITAKADSTVVLGTSFPGEIVELNLDGGSFILGDGAYVAHIGEIDVNAEFGGLSSLFSGSGLFFLNVSGKGKVFVAGESGVQKVVLKEGDSIYVDNFSFVAVSGGASIEKVFLGKGLKSKLLSGEGVVFKINGPAEVYYRAASPKGLLETLRRYLK